MVKITFIQPSMGRKEGEEFVETWQMEPLAPAIIKSLTPASVDFHFYDDRVEELPLKLDTDLVAISVESYSARRAYELATLYRSQGIPVLMGGFHATLMTDEVLEFADHVVVGEIENQWKNIIDDLLHKKMKRLYRSPIRPSLKGIVGDRSIFKNKKYLPLRLVETGRGCRFVCDFCSITQFFDKSYLNRPIEDVVNEIKSLPAKLYFFVDDNICTDIEHAKKLLRALIPLKIRWISQGTINMAQDPELLTLMAESGCEAILIGFESLDMNVLQNMKKGFNLASDIDVAVSRIHDRGIKIYATFVFGYDGDQKQNFERAFQFSMKHKFYLAAFNHLIPFPGTPLYKKMAGEGRMRFENWWLDHSYTFGEIAFAPENYTPEELRELCLIYRKKFYNPWNTFRRFLNWKTNFRSFDGPFYFWFINYISGRDVIKRQGIPMGMGLPIEKINQISQ